MKFEQLEIIPEILRALEDKNYSQPTPIQEKTIPLILEKRDILGSAQTGTGKTAAFAIPIIQQIQKMDGDKKGRPRIKALIVTPTRELAIQIDENIREYSKYTKIKHTVIFGGVKQTKQTGRLKNGVDILTATPGRLLDLISQGLIRLDDIKLFVLDEADRMLDMGFLPDVKRIIKILPKKRQSLFFSATLPQNIVELSKTILNNPKKVEVSPVSSTADTVQQYVYFTNKLDKKDLLLHILKDQDINQVLLFSRTKHGADKIARNLKKKGINAEAIHGDKAQNRRQKVLTEFKAGAIRVLVATDIAARGIDINKLRYVINYDIPNVPEDYVHRIGRSGRAGEEGISISISEPEENTFIRNIEKLIKQKISVVKDNPFPQTEKPMSTAEKKEWEKEKQRKKQEFFENRRKKTQGQGNRNFGGNKKSGGGNRRNMGR